MQRLIVGLSQHFLQTLRDGRLLGLLFIVAAFNVDEILHGLVNLFKLLFSLVLRASKSCEFFAFLKFLHCFNVCIRVAAEKALLGLVELLESA